MRDRLAAETSEKQEARLQKMRDPPFLAVSPSDGGTSRLAHGVLLISCFASGEQV